MAVLLLAEVNGIELAVDATAKAVRAATAWVMSRFYARQRVAARLLRLPRNWMG